MQRRPDERSTAFVLDGIRRIVKALRLSGRQAEVELGISGAQLFVLRKLVEADHPLTLGDLAGRTLTDPSSVSTVVARLVDRGYVLRSTSPVDRRRVELKLSAKGRTFLEREVPETAQERLADAVRRLSPADRDKLAELLGTVIADAGFASDAPMFFEEPSDRP